MIRRAFVLDAHKLNVPTDVPSMRISTQARDELLGMTTAIPLPVKV